MSNINYKVYYINLEYRKDRQYSILQQLHNVKKYWKYLDKIQNI